jgi:hypothetical protein
MTSPPQPECSPGDTPVPRRHIPVLVLGCTVLALAGIFATVGCLLALYLELTGFSTSPEEKPRGAYTASLMIGAAAGLLLPAYLARLMVHGRYRVAAGTLAAAITATAVVVSSLGTWR